MANQPPSHANTGIMQAAPTKKKSGLLGSIAEEFTHAMGFVGLITAASAVAGLAMGTIAASAAGTVALVAAAGVGMSLVGLSVSTMIHNHKTEAAKEQQAAVQKPTRVIVNNIQVQPNVEVEAKAKFFTKMIEAERAALTQDIVER